MFVIEKITQRYDPAQDRIALTIQDAGKGVLSLWLTQRLANGLAGALAKWLDDRVKSPASKPAAQERDDFASNLPAFSKHTWEQWAAQAKMKPGRPVNVAASLGDALVDEVDLKLGRKVCALTFKWGPKGAALLSLDSTQLRQWLIILHRQFKIGGWSEHAWPHWITEGEENRPSSVSKHEVN